MNGWQERITDDVVSTCMQCGTKSDRISNCQEAIAATCCLVQCDACATKYADCCSLSCREIHQLPEEAQRAWRKGRSTRSTKTKAINRSRRTACSGSIRRKRNSRSEWNSASGID
jgi:hypothetical protein